MEYAIVAYPAAPVRRKPRHASEMVNQLLFGETVEVLKSRGELWLKVRSLHDGYEGWVTRTLLEGIGEKMARDKYKYVSGELMSRISLGERSMHIPAASTLPMFDGISGEIAGQGFSISGKVYDRKEHIPSPALLRELAYPWLNAPYLWGGRTALGIDCSGLVQVIFKMMGIDLPRDAWQQAQQGRAIKKFRDALPGDLLFFDDMEEIVHVGILCEPNLMIHASGKVKMDAVTKKGIVNPETTQRVLRLQAIRRIFLSADHVQP